MFKCPNRASGKVSILGALLFPLVGGALDSDGVVTGWGVGTATITASDPGASGTATVTVQEGQG